MPTLAEVKDLIIEDRKNTELIRAEVDKLKGDAVDQASFKKLEDLVTKGSEERQAKEAEYAEELKQAKQLAEEAALKAGRIGSGSDQPATKDAEAYKSSFLDFVRQGAPDAAKSMLSELEAKDIGSATGSGSGVAVPTMIATQIHDKTTEESTMAGLVKVVTVGTSDYKELVDKGGMAFGWVGAGDTRTPGRTPDVYEVEPSMGTIYAYPEVQEEQLDDVFFDVEAWLVKSAKTAFANGRDVAIISGDGLKKPIGMLNTAPVAAADGTRANGVYQYSASGVADSLGVADNLIKLIYAVKAKYRANGKWAMNSATTAIVRTMKDGNGRFLWNDSLAVGEPATLVGYAVAHAEAMPGIAANATPLGFGDFEEAYTLVERHGFRLTPDAITKPGFKRFHMRERVGGAPTNDDAVKFLKCALS